MADPVLHHHAWARVENGVVTRAYAWVNETVWNQGAKTLAEIELNMKCFGYGEDAGMDDATMEEYAAANVGKMPSLAARWSFDPAPSRRAFAKSRRRHRRQVVAGLSRLGCGQAAFAAKCKGNRKETHVIQH